MTVAQGEVTENEEGFTEDLQPQNQAGSPSSDVRPGSETPAHGTLAWLALQPTVELAGEQLPAVHRIPEGSTLHPEADGRCRLIRPDGDRCKAPATRRYGLCLVHAGGGGMADPAALSRRGHAAKARMKTQRALLGIGPRRIGDPRQQARLRAAARADELADALLSPLDDRELGSLSRQRAAVTVLDATFPIQTATVELELPLDSAGVTELGWQDMQQLAARLLDQDMVSRGVPVELEASTDAG